MNMQLCDSYPTRLKKKIMGKIMKLVDATVSLLCADVRISGIQHDEHVVFTH